MPGKFLIYVANAADNELVVLEMASATDAPTIVQRLTIDGGAKAGGLSTPMAISPDLRFLHVAIRTPPLPVVSFAIDPKDGRLTLLGAARLPASTPYVLTDRSGRFLFSAANPGATLAINRIGADGRVEPHAHQVLHIGHKLHCVAIDRENRHLYVSSTDDRRIFQFAFDVATGHLTALDPPSILLERDGDPRHLAFSPDGRFLYATTEAGGRIACFAVDAAGRLSECPDIGMMPDSFSGHPLTADIHLTPDGGFLYATERALDRIVAYRVDAGSGHLSPIGAYVTEKVPRTFAIAPDSGFLLVAGEVTGRISAYAIDGSTGRLAKGVDFPIGSNPSWIEVVRRP